MGLMISCSLVAVFVTVGIVFSLVFESVRFFQMVPLTEFLFGTRWEPQIPIRADQIAAAQAGQQRARNIQDNINIYGRPYGAYGAGLGFGFGYGLGLSGGRLYNYPY